MDTSFRADGGVLRLEVVKFLPDGLRLAGETYGWDDVGGVGETMRPERWTGLGRHGWSVAWQPIPGNYLGVAIQLEVAAPGVARRTVPIGAGFVSQGNNDAITALALAAYLHDEPAARAGLADPRALLAVTKGLRDLPRHKLPREPLMGDKYDLHFAVLRGYRRALPRRYDDRRVDTDPAPSVAAVVEATALPERLTRKFSADDVAERAERYVTRPPWPFGVLLGDR